MQKMNISVCYRPTFLTVQASYFFFFNFKEDKNLALRLAIRSKEPVTYRFKSVASSAFLYADTAKMLGLNKQ